MTRPLNIVFIGLSISSSWGNGHATTYRSLMRGLAAEGHKLHFMERDVPWYAAHRDLPEPEFCKLSYYSSPEAIGEFERDIVSADAVILGSYVPDGQIVIDKVAAMQPRLFCFYDIDTPVTMAALDRGEETFLARRQVPLFDIYYSFSGGEVLTRLEQEYGAERAEALYCSVDAERYRPTGEEIEWELGYLGTYSPDRQPVLEELLLKPARMMPDRRFVVAGSQYPDDIEWPANVERIDHLPPEEHPSFYSRQKFTLNVTRADMVAAGWSPSVRLFEAAACATPIISDRWRGIGEVLPEGEAIIIADKASEVVRHLTSSTPQQRQELGASARSRVLNAHTGMARAKELETSLRKAAGRASRFAQAV